MSSTPLVASPTSSVDFAVPTFIANEATQAIVASSSQLSTGLSGSQLSVGALLSTIAEKFKVSSTTLYNLSNGESSLNPDQPGDWNAKLGVYCSWGLTQQNICAHPEITKEQATDPVWALTKAAKDLRDGNESIYSVCNCYAFIQANYIHNLPRMADITVNTNVPHKGDVAIFWYHDKNTGKIVKHIAYVLDEKGTLSESNKTHCLVGRRVIHTDDPYLAGYYDPRV